MEARITSDGTPTGTRIFVGDTQISGLVRSVVFRHTMNRLPELELEMVQVVAQEITGQVRWYMPGIGSIKSFTLDDGTVIELDKEEHLGIVQKRMGGE